MKKRYQKMIGGRKILMPITDAQQLMVIADDFCVLNDNRTQDSIINMFCFRK